MRAAQALSAAFRSLEAAPVGKAYGPVVEAAQAMVEALLAKETNEEVRPCKASYALAQSGHIQTRPRRWRRTHDRK